MYCKYQHVGNIKNDKTSLVFLSSRLHNLKFQTRCQSLRRERTRRSNRRVFTVNCQTSRLNLCVEGACSGHPICWGRGTLSAKQTDWASSAASCSHAPRDRSSLSWSRNAWRTWGSPHGDSVRRQSNFTVKPFQNKVGCYLECLQMILFDLKNSRTRVHN